VPAKNFGLVANAMAKCSVWGMLLEQSCVSDSCTPELVFRTRFQLRLDLIAATTRVKQNMIDA
jgi:hypothetical protein